MLVFAKLLFIILGIFLQFQLYTVNALNIAVVLMALILTSLPEILRTNLLGERELRLLTWIAWTAYLLAALFLPEMRCYIPLAMMDVWGFRLISSGILGCAGILAEMLLGSPLSPSLSHSLFLALFSLCAVLLQHTIRSNETLSHELRRLRDTSKEHELLVEEKNRRMREQQDAELYAATLKERNRIAREIHDNVGHMLTRSILQMGAIKTINTNEMLKEPLEGLHETLNTAMTNIRVSVHDLHDESIDLPSAIREITDPVDTVSIHLDYDMSSHVPRTIKYCFISIIKEAVNNMLKHSNATRMDIIVQEHPAFYQLLLQDNGTDIHVRVSDGIGLTNMKDRVKVLNGNIKISTNDGFKILISIIKSNLTNAQNEA